MKIHIDDVRITPPSLDFAFCVYGEPSETIIKWANHWGFKSEKSGAFTNFLIPQGYNITQCFEEPECFEYLDGFSPNLNKHLHIGHFSNLIIAKALSSLRASKSTVSILGDTLKGEVHPHDALTAFIRHCEAFDYKVSQRFFASEVELTKEQEDILLTPGEGDYEGTMCFTINDQRVVGRKADGNTTYFYQDIALAHLLKKPYLIITGTEQKEHFAMVKQLCPWAHHLGIGLVKNNGVKMSSRAGNVIMMDEIIDELNLQFYNIELTYNAVAGQILNYSPSSEKNIVKSQLTDPKHSPGVYLSYAMARLFSAGCTLEIVDNFQSIPLQYAWMKSKVKLDPSILLKALVEHAKTIHALYEKHTIKDNFENRLFFNGLLSDLALGMTELGLFIITQVPNRKETQD